MDLPSPDHRPLIHSTSSSQNKSNRTGVTGSASPPVTSPPAFGGKPKASVLLLASDVKSFRNISNEAKLNRILNWAIEDNFEPPSDIKSLPKTLQGVFQWLFKHLKSHRDALSFVAKIIKPWEEVVQQCTLQNDVPKQEATGTTSPPEGHEAEVVSIDSVSFGSLSLNWLVRTTGTLKEHDHRISVLEEVAQVMRNRLDKIVADSLDMGRVSRRPAVSSKHDVCIDLLSEKQSPQKHILNEQSASACDDHTDDMEVGGQESVLSFGTIAKIRTLAKKTSSRHSARRSLSKNSENIDKHKLDLDEAGSHASTDSLQRMDSNLVFVTRPEHNDLQEVVQALSESLSLTKADVDKHVQALHLKMIELERSTTNHLCEIRESARSAAVNVATCDRIMFEGRDRRDGLGLDHGRGDDEGHDERLQEPGACTEEQKLDHEKVSNLEKVMEVVSQDIKELQTAVLGQQPFFRHSSSSDLDRLEALRTEACDVAREHAERVAERAEIAIMELEQRFAHFSATQVPSLAQERACTMRAIHEKAGVHKWSCSTQWPPPPSSLADARRTPSPDRTSDTTARSRPASASSRPRSATRFTTTPPSKVPQSSFMAQQSATNAGAAPGFDEKSPPASKFLTQTPEGHIQNHAAGQTDGMDTSMAKEEEVIVASPSGSRKSGRVARHSPILHPGMISGKVETVRIGGTERVVQANDIRRSAGEESGSGDGDCSSVKSAGTRPRSSTGRRFSARGSPVGRSESISTAHDPQREPQTKRANK